MKNCDNVKISMPSDFEIEMEREFNAPRRLVFEAWTKPELVRRWMLGPEGWTMPVCEIDLRVGGAYRYMWRHSDGREMGMGGVYREIVRPERLVVTEKFDEAWYPGEAVATTVLIERDGRTIQTTTVRYATKEARDAVLKTGMTRGVAASYNRVEELLVTLLAEEAAVQK